MTRCLAAVAVAACLTFPAPAAFAQGQSALPPPEATTGACGQPASLTWTLPGPLDAQPLEPLTLTFLRGEPAYLQFSLAAPARVGLRTETLDTEVDPYLSLFAAAGDLVASDDDGAGGYNAVIDVTLDPGDWCVQLRPYSPGASGETQIILHAAAGAAAEELLARTIDGPPEAGELCADPAFLANETLTIAPGMSTALLTARLDPGARRDWRVTVTEATPLQVDAVSEEFDTYLRLADTAGMIVAENDDGPSTGTNSVLLASVQAGDYCLSLSPFDDAGGIADLSLKTDPDYPVPTDITAACTDPAQTSDFGLSLSMGFGTHSVAGSLSEGLRSDWTFDVTEAGTYQFDLSSQDFDATLTLLDAAGTILAENDDGPESLDSRIVTTLAPGRYCLAAASLDGTAGTFSLGATDTPTGDAPPSPFVQTDPCTGTGTLTLPAPLAAGVGAADVPAQVAFGQTADLLVTVAEPFSARLMAVSGDFDTVLALTDMTGVVLAENDDGVGMGTDSQIDIALEPGTYCLRLNAFGGGEGAAQILVGDTGLDPSGLNVADVVLPPEDQRAGFEDLGALDSSLQSAAPSEDLAKWMTFTSDREGPVRIAAVSLSGAFRLALVSETGEILVEATGEGGILPVQVEADLGPGRYYLLMQLRPSADTRLRNITVSRL